MAPEDNDAVATETEVLVAEVSSDPAPAPAADAEAPRAGMSRVKLLLVAMLTLLVAVEVVALAREASWVPKVTPAPTVPAHTRPAASHIPGYHGWQPLPALAADDRKLAYFFYATDDGQACNALIAAKKLRKLGTPAHIDIVAMVIDEVTNVTRQHLADGGMVVLPVAPWRLFEDHGLYRDSLTKLRIFQETGYDRLVYIDSDTVIMRNLDELFNLPHAMFWAPRAYWLENIQPFITSVLLVVDPRNELFEYLEGAIARQPEVQYDMDILNIEWKHQAGILPSEYVVLTTHLQEDTEKYLFGFRSFEERVNHTYIHHFSRSDQYGKPWQMDIDKIERRPNIIPLFYDLYEEFWAGRRQYCPFL
ncbi:hypothetical protein ACHHYP_06163 [Achlya hypogyna]|uniref:Uncharacterized protein n=1 Tax=Achlya hypogyna TaxID=1202772 RepID=A0A1V9ZN75_ACHHY|nr:hypothetical protein ACHHYP_06163 [Achlya hypogyna]